MIFFRRRLRPRAGGANSAFRGDFASFVVEIAAILDEIAAIWDEIAAIWDAEVDFLDLGFLGEVDLTAGVFVAGLKWKILVYEQWW